MTEKTGEQTVIHIVACGVFAGELDAVAEKIAREGLLSCRLDITYLDQRLHVDFALLKTAVERTLAELADKKTVLLYGRLCHPDFSFVPESVYRPPSINCVEMLTGAVSTQEPRTFFLTPQQLADWREFFSFDGKSAEEKAAFRPRFCQYCDKAVLKDTGVRPFREEELRSFTEDTGLPIQAEWVGLKHFGAVVRAALRAALSGQSCE
jgi:hypothetical protein